MLEVTHDELFLLMLPECRDIVHTRTVMWSQFMECGYGLKFRNPFFNLSTRA